MTNKNVKISVLIAACNVEPYLRDCFNSLLQQTYTKFEAVVVDDASSDLSGSICDEYAAKDSRFKVIHNENNLGLGEVRNILLREASGEWITFIDGDDYVSSQYLETLLLAVKECNCLISKVKLKKTYRTVRSNPVFSQKFQVIDIDDFFIECLNGEGYIYQGCAATLFHKSLFEGVVYEKKRHTVDALITQMLLDRGSKSGIAVAGYDMYYYRQRNDSILNSKVKLSLLNESTTYGDIIEFWKKRQHPIIVDAVYELYFATLISDYIQLRRDCQEQISEYDFLKDSIMAELPNAVRKNHSWLMLPTLEFELIDYLKNKNVVIYDFSVNCWGILPWLEHYGVNVIEIWDVIPDENSFYNNIPIKSIHSNLPSDTVILLTVDSMKKTLSLTKLMNRLGYTDIIRWNTVMYSIRRQIYREYLPFLLT